MKIRDISIFNKNIKQFLIFRSSEVKSIEDLQTLKKLNIRNIFDFRCEYEIKLNDFSKLLPNEISYFNMPIETHHAENLYEGSPMESVYKYFANDCKGVFAEILNKLISANGSILLTCRFGMDRTGVIVAILHLICNTPLEKIKEDYLASGEIMVKKHLDIFLNIISKYDNIYSYFSEYLTAQELQQLKLKILIP